MSSDGGVTECAAPGPDAGTLDGGSAADAGVGADAGTIEEPAGCGCRVGPRREAPLWVLVALALALVARRRRA